MSHSHMSMGSMSLPALEVFPTFYWAVVGSAIGVATLINIYNYVLYRQRMSAARLGSQTPAKPTSWFTIWNATLFAFTREASNYSIHIPLKNRIFRLPTVGRATLISVNVAVLVVLCLYGFDLNDIFSREDIGFRCGVITIAQLPLIFLLSGKNNIVGHLSGISYERLNWLHRWCARCMLLTATMHMGYFFGAWAPYNYIGYQLKNNKIVWKGLASWCTLAWIVFSSMAPIRGWCYEFFVIQHIISFAAFLGFVYIHTPVDMHIYIWIPVGLYAFDRVFRFLRIIYANVSVFHPSMKRQGQKQGLLTCNAEFTPLPHNTTHIVVHNPPIKWSPGQHVFLSCQAIAPLQNHPFTVASIPEDGRMEFFVKAESGGTKRFFKHAEKSSDASRSSKRSRTVTIEGPYGCIRPLRQFDSVIFLAGSTGATYTVPLLRDIIQGWKETASRTESISSFFSAPSGAATRHVRFVWVVKSRGQIGWFSEQLSSVSTEFQTLQDSLKDIKLELTVYVTCDDAFTEEHRSFISSLTTPNPKTIPQTSSEHGAVTYRGRLQSADEVYKSGIEKDDVREVTKIRTNDENEQKTSCGPDGTCCCRTTVDENAPTDSIGACCCSNPKDTAGVDATSRPTSQVSSTPSSSKQKFSLHPSITVYSGRPKTRDIIRRSLEKALGESAVVVCGPRGLVTDVKQDVCSLSDERAVHKGTGAQGIYLHTESYSY